MAKKLLETSLGWLPPDDRDSYLNKRIELTGTLLNNLFRNYFNKLIKEMQKQVVREINNGSWKSMEDYENIINMTNIYKIMKSTTIENGINRALSTGDFSIKQSNSSKVGVAQVLNRLTYVASLSHLRRINTPLEKSGELIAPRKLHNTTWGFLCPAETPEGQSIGVVKNISYMTHITIPTNSSSLYEYVIPFIRSVDSVENPVDLYDKVKVFINGCWVGVTETPMDLYVDMKNKKYRGIINIYTSIVFDYKTMEIRICNDGGRLARPVLRVRDNRALLTPEIVHKIATKQLSWNDLLTNCRMEESVIEYIDPEEQNYSMIAMKSKNRYLVDPRFRINYTHCEIHPSTIFGVLASCIPFPEHNQAPRNTYQCLHPDTTVWMANLTQKPIKDVRIGESVLTFHPESLDITTTTVVNQFVRENEHPIYKITTVAGREIIATEDHRFMTENGWKTVKELMDNSMFKIGLSMNNRTFNPEIEDDLSDIKCILSYEQFILKMRELGVEETTNRKINKVVKYANTLKEMGLLPLMENNKALPILSRLIGFINTDGLLNIYSKSTTKTIKMFQCSVDFGLKMDAEEFQNDLTLCGFSENKIMEGTRIFTKENRQQTHHTFTIIYNGVLPAFLVAIGAMYGKRTETIRKPVPEWICSNRECSRQFLKGFQGGDGCKITWDKPTTQYYSRISMHGTTQQIEPKYVE